MMAIVTDASDLVPRVIEIMNRNALRIPPYPAVAMRLQQKVSGDYGIDELEKIVGEDQTLAATLLRYANSAIYRRVTPTTTLNTAIMRIGANDVARIALSLSTGARATANGVLTDVRRKSWHSALLSALCCRAVGYWRQMNADEAYICGLLHDFGQVVAASALEDLLTKSHDQRTLPQEAWAQAVDSIHVQVGLAVAVRWNLSPMLRAVIGYHHTPERSQEFRPMLALMSTADSLVGLLSRNPLPSKMELVEGARMQPAEAEYLMTVLPSIAASIAALDDTRGVAESGTWDIPSQVAKPATALSGPSRAISLGVTVMRSSGNIVCKATCITRDGIGFSGSIKIRENSMIRLRVDAPKGALDVWAVVALCEPEGDGFRIEARLFAATPELQTTWSQLYSAAC